MIVISSREFRQNQKLYFEKVDQGEQVIVQRGKDKAYALTPVTENDRFLNRKMIEKITDSLNQVKEGKTRRVSSASEIDELLGL
jgi:hypothetical protein